MKIFYGVQGTGNGHISRARMMAKQLASRGIEVQYLFSGRAPEKYFDMEDFGDYQTRYGLSFITQNGAVSHWQTLLAAKPIQLIRDIRELDLSDYDVVISDFEPVSAWAAKLQNKPVVGIGHQYAFQHPEVPQSALKPWNRLIMRHFAPANYELGMHWSAFNGPILPPIINPDERATPNTVVPYTLVYLPFENQHSVVQMLNTLPSRQFILYSPDVDDGMQGNVRLQRSNYHGFKKHLCGAENVICNSGFELISECLHMGIPILCKPLAGQPEQLGNAQALEQLNLATVLNALSVVDIEQWLAKEKVRPAANYPNVAGAICDWLLSENYNQQTQLSEQLWPPSH